ncbi:MAG TPA: serine/threonine-protein kinase [Nannocystaceae bacterium]|nr:serine/threonine-protein kinase [Nannocystaceae bacterium]
MFELPTPPHDPFEEPVRRRLLEARLLGLETAPVQLGPYRLERVLGRGAMGVVYLGRDPRLDRAVAIKLLRDEAELGARRLEREARALARLSHPNVVTIHEVGEHDGRTFIAMEHVPGRNLQDWMETPHPLAERIEMLRQAALGLQAAHAIGLIHRDFKPHNAIVGDDGRLRIVDFGLATIPSERELPTAPIPVDDMFARMTATGACLGTPAYMAPELWAGVPPSPASDQFALCCVGWELLFAKHPFEGGTRGVVPRPPTDPRLSTALTDALVRGLAVDPQARNVDLDAIVHACSKPHREGPRRRELVVATVGATMLTGVAVWFLGVAAPTEVGAWLDEPERAVAASASPTCTQVLADSDSRRTIESDLDDALHEARTASGDARGRAELRAAIAELSLGRWRPGCDRLARIDGEAAVGDAPACWRARYCESQDALPERARCFGGDVELCLRIAIKHEYEFLDSTQDRSAGARSSAELHRALWTEVTTAACDHGDAQACNALATSSIAEDVR